MCDTTSYLAGVTIKQFAQNECRGAPLTDMLHTRFPKTLAMFVRTAALTEGVSESAVLRYACEQWAHTQGYSRSGM